MKRFNFDRYNKIVIKVGSALVAPSGESCSTQYCLPIANFIKKCISLGKTVTLVSSGAVAAGYNTLRPQHQSLTLDEKQALAAVGQSKVISHWQRFFDLHVAQVLLTSADINNQNRALNAQKTLNTLHKLGALPVVNENDTVVTEELKFGDNDNLAAQVAKLIDAELLVICSDVDGLYDANPKLFPEASLIHRVTDFSDEIMALGQDSTNPKATGGMKTKLLAAKLANSHGINTVICNGTNESYMTLINNEISGTWLGINK